jgi:tricorn protease
MYRHFVSLSAAAILLTTWLSHLASANPSVQLVGPPSVSPDGKQLAFAWNGDIWTVAVEGGTMQQLTSHPADDSGPIYSRDGSQIAFVSDRTGADQVYVMPAAGGAPRQVTWHTEGYRVHDWWPDGESLLVTSSRDHHWRHAERMFRIWIDGRRNEQLLVDAAAADPALSPDGKQILLVREGERWWRKGYHGARAAQIWLYDLETEEFRQLLGEPYDCRWPVWCNDGAQFYYTMGDAEGFDLWRAAIRSGKGPATDKRRMVDVDTFSVLFPAASCAADTIVYRHGKDLYSWNATKRGAPKRISMEPASDVYLGEDRYDRQLSRAEDVAFSDDGLEIAFIAGGDVWVMDTILREPRQVTNTPEYETSVAWGPAGKTLWYIQHQSTRTDIFKAEREDSDQPWWRTDRFRSTPVTDDGHTERGLQFTPDGKHLLYIRSPGELWVRSLAEDRSWLLARGFDNPQFDISPDSRWVAYSQSDDNFNRDIFIAPIDASEPAVNVSQHPDDDEWPAFSRDGKILAYIGRQVDDEPDIYYVYLERELHEKSSRERKLEEALKKLAEARKEEGKPEKAKEKSSSSDSSTNGKEATKEEKSEGKDESEGEEKAKKAPEPLKIDLDRIHERVRRIAIGGARERPLVWIADQKLLFQATIDGRSGTYLLKFPDELQPKFFSNVDGRGVVWSDKAKALFLSDSGIPTRVSANGDRQRYEFSARQSVSRSKRYGHALDVAWKTMRDRWYDPRLGNRDWNEIRRRYRPLAEQAPSQQAFAEVVELMLGELNGSHLGFRPGSDPREWQGPQLPERTPHLGVRFVESHDGPGLKIRDVLPTSPADRSGLDIAPGDLVVAIDGVDVGPETDLARVLNGRLDRDIRLTLLPKRRGDKQPEEREVVIRPTSYSRARQLLYDQWLDDNRQRVEALSGGSLGYLHIRQMNMPSFSEFERQLYAAGNGKQGLVIDVRDNGGGSTADLLLTALTQPRHATTIPRGGGPGYPQSRMVFATWQKPIVVLCNQNSYSNAEIFSHAIKTLGRGKLVGVPTAGGVISTGSTQVLDVGTMRMPFRGWFVAGTGEDMELNGAVPDVILWPEPGELPQGIDRQLERGVEVLLADLTGDPQQEELKYATEREPPGD